MSSRFIRVGIDTQAVHRWLAASTARLVLVGLVVSLILLPLRAHADPSGNNGTVKIDGIEFDDHPNNEPHVGCQFQVDFYGYDEGDLTAEVTFQLHAPTGNRVIGTDHVLIGEDPGGGGTDLDATALYDISNELSGVSHGRQGFHVKLTVNAEGSIGADVKRKVFWITGCETTPTSPS